MKNALVLLFLFCVSLAITAGCQHWPKLGASKGRDRYRTVKHPIYDVARSISRFEDQLREDGTISVKSPDVWIDSSLMHSIQEFDGLMEDSADDFKETIQAMIAESARAGIASETSVGINTGGAATAPDMGDVSTTNIMKASEGLFSALRDSGGLVDDEVEFRLEPTQRERQKATYINVNQALRRKKLGGDNIRMPGYGLYLFRIPVSVLPGVETSQGYSAVVNMRARMVVTASDIKHSLPRMAIAELVDRMAEPVHELWLTRNAVGSHLPPITISQLKNVRVALQDDTNRVGSSLRRFTKKFPGKAASYNQDQEEETTLESANPLVETAQPPMRKKPRNRPRGKPKTALPPLQDALRPETSLDRGNIRPAESERLSLEAAAAAPIAPWVVELPSTDPIGINNESPGTTELIYQSLKNKYRKDGVPQLHELREMLFQHFLQISIHLQTLGAFDFKVPTDTGEFDAIQCAAQYIAIGKPIDDIKSHWIAALTQQADYHNNEYYHSAWEVAKYCGLADYNIKRLIDDMVLRGRVPQQLADDARNINFMSEYHLETATEIWNEVLKVDFPLQVFAIEPSSEEQNLLDSQSRLRQLQMALAASIANGGWNVRQRVDMAKEIARDSAAIGLNRTNVGFVHGMDTFGWYFHPRVQSPEVNSGPFSTIQNTFNPETRAQDAKTYRLEPGMRECEVLISMPSFVSEVAFDVTTNWESLAEPGRTKRGYEELIGEGCHLQKLRKSLAEKDCLEECREGDVARLYSRLDQLEQMLSLQTYRVSVPYEHDQPFNRIFNEGENSLKPELYGFHGLHYLVPPQKKSEKETREFKAEFFLTGRNFHPTLTHVIIGGHESDSAGSYSDTNKDPEVEILSRELIRVQVTIKTDLMNKEDTFEVRVGTPGGMSGPVEIQAFKKKEGSESSQNTVAED